VAVLPSELLTGAGRELVAGGESTPAQRKTLTSVLASRAFLFVSCKKPALVTFVRDVTLVVLSFVRAGAIAIASYLCAVNDQLCAEPVIEEA
jgi:hypothetical protein